MESQSLILGIVIVALAALFVIWPFIGMGRAGSEQKEHLSGDLEQLIAQRDAVYATIRDLDFDHETGKLTDEDYHSERNVWVARGVDILKAIDTLQQEAGHNGSAVPDSFELSADAEIDAQIEAAVAARRRTG